MGRKKSLPGRHALSHYDTVSAKEIRSHAPSLSKGPEALPTELVGALPAQLVVLRPLVFPESRDSVQRAIRGMSTSGAGSPIQNTGILLTPHIPIATEGSKTPTVSRSMCLRIRDALASVLPDSAREPIMLTAPSMNTVSSPVEEKWWMYSLAPKGRDLEGRPVSDEGRIATDTIRQEHPGLGYLKSRDTFPIPIATGLLQHERQRSRLADAALMLGPVALAYIDFGLNNQEVTTLMPIFQD